MNTLERIDGTLCTPSGYVYPARLNLTVEERGEAGRRIGGNIARGTGKERPGRRI